MTNHINKELKLKIKLSKSLDGLEPLINWQKF